ncbi:PEP-CTERM sorting domain-containing protein [Rugamonas aquatica]|uniref:PEP-CTERM sorting domain-containing protein n=1 Tax=Rugamonas aquatica TaxID=2743357 RepID=A0A6A7MXT7_9BURK|nr:PEP-CTERM sorting domain-containing protein [Rugamonas aquatica]MQA37552.1 PEP-CTERM sorting domain-containing protein [Rugamonas aquatica]
MTLNKAMMALVLSLAGGTAMAVPHSATVDFSKGQEGWWAMQPLNGVGGSGIDTSMGHAAPALRTVIDNFGVSWGTHFNQAFLGDYTKLSGVTIGLDISAQQIDFFGQEVSRDLVVELRDYDNKPANLPYTSVFYNLGSIDSTKGWQHLSVTIGDTKSLALPAGWGGYGGPDAQGPTLPSGRTFASVLASVDEVVFTTLKPGYAFDYARYDVAIDNLSITPVPEPSTYGMLIGGLGLVGWMARRKARSAA